MERKLQEIEIRVADTNDLLCELHDKVDQILELLSSPSGGPAVQGPMSDPRPVQSDGTGTTISEPAWLTRENEDSTLEKFLQGMP